MNRHFAGQQHLGLVFGQEGGLALGNGALDGAESPGVEVSEGSLGAFGGVWADCFRDGIGGRDRGDDGGIAGEDLCEPFAGYAGGIGCGRHCGGGGGSQAVSGGRGRGEKRVAVHDAVVKLAGLGLRARDYMYAHTRRRGNAVFT